MAPGRRRSRVPRHLDSTRARPTASMFDCLNTHDEFVKMVSQQGRSRKIDGNCVEKRVGSGEKVIAVGHLDRRRNGTVTHVDNQSRDLKFLLRDETGPSVSKCLQSATAGESFG